MISEVGPLSLFPRVLVVCHEAWVAIKLNYFSILILAVNEPGMVESINSHLPADIRVQGIKRVTKNFNSKNK